ncbi:MAG: MFS transporter [Terracoccus sp.]
MSTLTTTPPVATPTAGPASGRRRGSLGPAAGFRVVSVAFLTVMAFATVPTPLYALYQARDGFSSAMVTVVFAAFAVGVMLSLYLVGHLSDTVGRRPLVLFAIVTEVASATIFLSSAALPALLVARLLCGIGVGALAATATAHLGELHLADRPDERTGRPATVAGLANIGGLALGPLVGGLLAELAPAPLRLPYAVFLVLLLVAAAAVALVPETVERPRTRPAYRPQRVVVPRESRSAFAAAGAAAFTAFAVFGMFTALAPTFLVRVLHESDHIVAGAVTFSVFAAAALAQVGAAGWSTQRSLQVGAAAQVLGLLGVLAGAAAGSLPAFVAGGVVAGAGVGLFFRSAVGRAGSLAPVEVRGETLSAIFLTAYAGLTVPVLLIGLALTALTPLVVLMVFVVAVSAATVGAAWAMRTTS